MILRVALPARACLASLAFVAVGTACTRQDPALDVRTAAAATIPAAELPPPVVVRHPVALPPALPPLADSIAGSLVFAPKTQSWFTAATRGKRMLVDIGRVDTDVKPRSRRVAYLHAVEQISPVPMGSRFRLHGAWGAEDVEVTGFDVWNGRIVATVSTSERLDSLVRRKVPLVAAALRTDSTSDAVADTCRRDTLSTTLARRVTVVRDSIEQNLRTTAMPKVPDLVKSTKVQSTQVAGCFGVGTVVMNVSLRAGGNSYVQERVVAVDGAGRITPLKVRDYRFRGHDLLSALDADGDGVDDVAAKGFAEAAGGTVILKMNGKRLERLTGGFAWEAR